MKQKTKVCSDGFIWLILNNKQACKIFNEDILALYTLYDDETEAMIESVEKLKETIDKGLQIGIEVGFVSEMIRAM